jgi:hypothetical protein
LDNGVRLRTITRSPAFKEILVSDPAAEVTSFEEAFLIKGSLCGGFVTDITIIKPQSTS